jgi:hypothetical protein
MKQYPLYIRQVSELVAGFPPELTAQTTFEANLHVIAAIDDNDQSRDQHQHYEDIKFERDPVYGWRCMCPECEQMTSVLHTILNRWACPACLPMRGM